MKSADAAALAMVHDQNVFIRRAGHAVAHAAKKMMKGAYGRRVLVLAGPGNNGNDGRVAAEWLRSWGAHVEELSVDDAGSTFINPSHADLVIDAAYGIGFHGSWNPPIVFDVPVLAVDIPSGLDALTGVIHGGIIPADRTITFAAVKTGMLLGDGPAVCGEIDIVDVGIDPVDNVETYIVESHDVAAWLPPRSRAAHKWNHSVRVIAGSPGMGGAASLVSASAMRAGAGIVHLSWRRGEMVTPPTEVVGRALPETGWDTFVAPDIARFASLVVGPGLGRGDDIGAEVRALLAVAPIPTVIDGDGLLAAIDPTGGYSVLQGRTVPTILTPHDGEFAALGGDIQNPDRIEATRQLAALTGCVVLRKGATTVISDVDGAVYLVVSGDERLATAGSGDVLSGIIGAFLARGLSPHEAAAAGAFVHGVAGSSCAPEGTIARDVVAMISEVLSEVCGHVG
jgi:ADP-dependent NAD(P)H-hydrate dehydratase / NAD(P)H-hydrate epimerase